MRDSFLALSVAVVAALLFAACSDKEATRVFEASTEGGAGNGKVSLSGTAIRWSDDDTIRLFDTYDKAADYRLVSGAGASHAQFAYSSGSDLSGGTVRSVYPASLATSPTQITLPATQTTTDGSLSALPGYAVSNTNSLRYYNICGLVRFRLAATSDVSLCAIAVTTNIPTNGVASLSGSATSTAITTPSGSTTTTLACTTPQNIATPHDFYMYLPPATYTTFSVVLRTADGATCTRTASSPITITRAQITNINLTSLDFAAPLPAGALPGKFSIGAHDTVRFAQGNLQYQASSRTWRFHNNQYDMIRRDNENVSSTYSGWIDLFGWGTSGWNSHANAYQPWSTSTTNADYYPGGSKNNALTGSYARADWGVYNAIDNGGNAAGLWRVLTRDEWAYLSATRSASTVGGVANARFTHGMVGDVIGAILFPDVYVHPASLPSPVYVNVEVASHLGNVYTAAEWALMEQAGAVFLPYAGRREGTVATTYNSFGCYWTSTPVNASRAWTLYVASDHVSPFSFDRSTGCAVRLVQPVQ